MYRRVIGPRGFPYSPRVETAPRGGGGQDQGTSSLVKNRTAEGPTLSRTKDESVGTRRKLSTWIEGSWKNFGIRHPGPPTLAGYTKRLHPPRQFLHTFLSPGPKSPRPREVPVFHLHFLEVPDMFRNSSHPGAKRTRWGLVIGGPDSSSSNKEEP